MPFAIKVLCYRFKMLLLKLVGKVLPFKWPTVLEGPGSALQLCDNIAAAGHQRVLLVTDEALAKLGLIDPIQQKLSTAGIAVTLYDGVQPDPTVEQIEAGFSVLQQHNCDAVLAVGGGSSIDAAKIIAARAKNNKPVADMVGLFKVRKGMLPLYAIPTTAGTGSEVTIGAVVSDPARHMKLPVVDTKLLPTAAALDAELMTGLPAAITAATGMDALTHAVEAYLSRMSSNKTDALALEAARLTMLNLPTAVADGKNLEARQNMARASHLAGLAITQVGVGYVHAIAHNFGAYYHTPHGLANAIVMPHVLEYSLPNCHERLAELARACNIGSASDSSTQQARAFVERIRQLNQTFNIPGQLEALQLSDIEAITDAALSEAHSTYAVPRYMDKPQCQQLIGQMLAT